MLITGLNPLRDARRDTPVPVARGFATWGTDSGHQNEKLAEPRAFALNDEALLNMAHAAYKKTHDVGVRLVRAFYDRAPAKMYFYGGSEGGREALMMAQRYPQDFDGIVSVVPVLAVQAFTILTPSRYRSQVPEVPTVPHTSMVCHPLPRAVPASPEAAPGVSSGISKSWSIPSIEATSSSVNTRSQRAISSKNR